MRVLVRELPKHEGQEVEVLGWLHWRRDLGGVRFALVRDRSGVVQVVLPGGGKLPLQESVVRARGKVVKSEKAPGGFEVHAEGLEVIAPSEKSPPVEIPKETWRANPETLLTYRYVTLRGEKARAPLKIQAALVRGFRKFLDDQGFTEIFTPKIVKAGAEGGSNLFELDYFGEPAYLAQSPQLYKQIMVGVFERVYEVAPVWRAEEHATSRHLNEYLSLDVEMGPIESEETVMALEESLIRAMLEEALEHAGDEIERLGATWPQVPDEFPRVTYAEARRIVKEELGIGMGADLNDAAERALGEYFSKKYGTDFIFIVDYPEEVRPFYTMPKSGGLTRGYDLLFRGLEITSGGQRIHKPELLVEQLRKKGMNVDAFRDYIEVFRYGMPPHGGFAIGAERLTQKLLDLPNVRYARAFPRDRHRLTP